jgi:HEAT repeat protein
MSRGIAFTLFVVVSIAVVSVATLAHDGEYRSPTPPPIPKLEKPPGLAPRGGVPTIRRKDPAGEITPPDRPRAPGEVTPGGEEVPEISRSLERVDDRFRWEIWWELDRDRFLGRRPFLESAARRTALEALRSLLRDPDPSVRGRALLSLGRLDDDESLAAALATVEDGGAGIHAATLALGMIGGEQARAKLKSLAQDAEMSLAVRVIAILALGLDGHESSRPFLREVVDEDTRPNPRSAALLALGLLRDEESVGRCRKLLAPRGPGSGAGDIDPLDDLVRCSAAFALGRIGTEPGRAALLNALEEGDGHAGGSAALALGALRDSAARAALRTTVLSERPHPTRALSIVALARLGDSELPGVVGKLLEEPGALRSNLGGVAIASLCLVGTSSDRERLVAWLSDEEIPPVNRAAAAAALACIGVRGAVPALTKILPKARHPFFRAHVVLALARLGAPDAGQAIAENIEKGRMRSLRRLTMTALSFHATPDATDRLVEGLAAPYYVNREAARSLPRADRNRALTGLMLRRDDEANPDARRFAADALGWLLTDRAPGVDIVRELNPLVGMPLAEALLYLGTEAYLYDLLLGL